MAESKRILLGFSTHVSGVITADFNGAHELFTHASKTLRRLGVAGVASWRSNAWKSYRMLCRAASGGWTNRGRE